MAFYVAQNVYALIKSLILIIKCIILYEICKENWDADKLPGLDRLKWIITISHQEENADIIFVMRVVLSPLILCF